MTSVERLSRVHSFAPVTLEGGKRHVVFNEMESIGAF